MNKVRKFQKKKLKEQKEWQRGGFRAPQHIIEMRQHSTNNRAMTPGRIGNIHQIIKDTREEGFFGKLKRLMRKYK